MKIEEVETEASRGYKRNEEAEVLGNDEHIAALEVRNKANDLLKELLNYERWDKNVIASKLASIVWFSSRLAGMYGINLAEEVKKKIEEDKGDRLEKPIVKFERRKDAKAIFRPKRKLPRLPSSGKRKN
jgi:hypothetical protein